MSNEECQVRQSEVRRAKGILGHADTPMACVVVRNVSRSNLSAILGAIRSIDPSMGCAAIDVSEPKGFDMLDVPRAIQDMALSQEQSENVAWAQRILALEAPCSEAQEPK